MSAASESLAPRSHLGSRLDWRLSPFCTTNNGFRSWVHSGCFRKFSSRLILQELKGTSLLTVTVYCQGNEGPGTNQLSLHPPSPSFEIFPDIRSGDYERRGRERGLSCVPVVASRGATGSRPVGWRGRRTRIIPPPQKKPCAMSEFAEDNLGNPEGLYHL